MSFINIFKNQKPARLEKELSRREKLDFWINRNIGYLILTGTILGLITFVLLCFLFIAPVESGIYYNHLNDMASSYLRVI